MKTSQHFPRQITLDELIYLQEASHANHIAPQESEWEKKTNATCGPRCLTLFESFNPRGSWAKMFAEYLLGMEGWYSKRCALTWKLVGTPYNRLYFQLAPSTLHTDETAFGLLPTPQTQGLKECDEQGRTQFVNLQMLPTPTTGADHATQYAQGGKSLRCHLGQTSQLNPRFVAEMMGFPPNWTELPFQSGETNLLKHTAML